MTSSLGEVKRVSKDILAVRIIGYSGDSLNFCVNFQERKMWYKDGFTFNGKWQNVETGKLEVEVEEKKVKVEVEVNKIIGGVK